VAPSSERQSLSVHRPVWGAFPGYVVDHKQALKHSGADTPGNMQWQTRAAAKAKDRIE
jgi:hypothetical protein